MAQRIPNHKYARWICESSDFLSEQRKNADKSWRYVDTDQLSNNDILTLEKRNQAPAQVNLILPMVNGASSIEASRRTDYIIAPTESSDEDFAQTSTQLVQDIFTKNNFRHQIGRAYRTGHIAGLSWFEIFPEKDPDTIDFTKDPEDEDNGQIDIKIKRRPMEEFYYDIHANEYALVDAEWISREVWFYLDDLKEKYPDKADEIQIFFESWSNHEFEGQEQEALITGNYSWIDKDRRRVAVHDMYYKTSHGQVKHVVFCGDVFLEGEEFGENPSPYNDNYIPYIAFVLDFDKKGRPMGTVQTVISVQDLVNKAVSKNWWYMSSNRVLAEQGTIKDGDAFREEIAKPDACYLDIAEGALANGRVKLENNLQESQNIMQWMATLIDLMQKIFGINDSLLGFAATNARSQSQEATRINQGASTQSTYLESLYYTKLNILKVVMKMMAQFYTKKRVVRLTQPNGDRQFVEINTVDEKGNPFNDMSQKIKFDAIVQEEEPFNSVAEILARNFTEIIKANPAYTPALLPAIMETMNGVPNKEKHIKAIQQISNPARGPQ